jgi:hypothetical protein
MSASATPTPDPIVHYTPSAQMAEKLAANRTGQLTRAQRIPIVIAGLVSSIGLLCPLTVLISSVGIALQGPLGGAVGAILLGLMFLSFSFLAGVLWVNARMFLPEALSKTPARWQRGALQIRMASRERPEMPFSYIIGSYSFAPFVPPSEVPLQTGREYVVYYAGRSRVFLSIAPTDQPESKKWLPKKGTV